MCVHAALDWSSGDGRQPILRLQEVADEDALWRLKLTLESKGYQVASWCEPDFGDQLAAIAVEHTKLRLPLLFAMGGGEKRD